MRKMFFLVLTLMVLSAVTMNAQVTIGANTSPNPGAVLDLKSTTQGVLMPQILLSADTTWTLTGSKTEGMVVYNTSDILAKGLKGKGIYVWFNSRWNMLGATSKPCPGRVITNGVWTGLTQTAMGGSNNLLMPTISNYFAQSAIDLCFADGERSEQLSFDDAKAYCAAKNESGEYGWRVPNIAELAQNGNMVNWVYPGANRLWSSTSTDSTLAWEWNNTPIIQAYAREKTAIRYVVCVRNE